MDGEFIEGLRKLMRKWHWTEVQIDKTLPRVLDACRRVGIVTWRNGELVGTDLIEDDEAWQRVWNELEEEGIGENYAE